MDYIKILGLVAAVLTTGANVPQAVKIIRTHSTESISALTYGLLFLGVVAWLIYGIFIDDLPIILANAVSAVLAGIILTMKLIGKKKENQDNPDSPS